MRIPLLRGARSRTTRTEKYLVCGLRLRSTSIKLSPLLLKYEITCSLAQLSEDEVRRYNS